MAAKKGIFGWLSAEKKESDEEKGEEPRMKEVSKVPKAFDPLATFNLPKFRIKYKGVFDLDALYRARQTGSRKGNMSLTKPCTSPSPLN